MMGDFNGKIGKESLPNKIIEKYGLKERNTKGKQLIEFVIHFLTLNVPIDQNAFGEFGVFSHVRLHFLKNMKMLKDLEDNVFRNIFMTFLFP